MKPPAHSTLRSVSTSTPKPQAAPTRSFLAPQLAQPAAAPPSHDDFPPYDPTPRTQNVAPSAPNPQHTAPAGGEGADAQVEGEEVEQADLALDTTAAGGNASLMTIG